MSVAIIASLLFAAAQPDPNALMRENEARAQQELARQRGVAQHNELMSLDARIRTEENARAVQPPLNGARAPVVRDVGSPNATLASPSMGGVAAIPDDVLRQSNERVRAAADNRR